MNGMEASARACISVKKGPRDLVGIFWESKLHIFCCSLLILFIYSVCLWVCVSVRFVLCVRVRKWIAYIEVFQRTIASRRRTIKKMRVWWKGTELANCNIRSDGPRRNAFDFMLFSYRINKENAFTHVPTALGLIHERTNWTQPHQNRVLRLGLKHVRTCSAWYNTHIDGDEYYSIPLAHTHWAV